MRAMRSREGGPQTKHPIKTEQEARLQSLSHAVARFWKHYRTIKYPRPCRKAAPGPDSSCLGEVRPADRPKGSPRKRDFGVILRPRSQQWPKRKDRGLSLTWWTWTPQGHTETWAPRHLLLFYRPRFWGWQTRPGKGWRQTWLVC